MNSNINASKLKTIFKTKRDEYNESMATRIHRAISWLAKAEAEEDDDAKLIFYWISFNAAYADSLSEGLETREQFKLFMQKLLKQDTQQHIHAMLFSEFNGAIRTLISNKYIYAPFWQAQRNRNSSSDAWQKNHSNSIKVATSALLSKDTITMLSIIFDRLYVLRNQLVHGGATWQSKINRQQVSDGSKMLGTIVPALIALLLDSASVDFGDIMYPVISS
jgi:hypothetical protein